MSGALGETPGSATGGTPGSATGGAPGSANGSVPAPTNRLWSGQAQMPSVLARQVEIVAADGNYVITRDGQRLFDTTAALWHTNIGHAREEMARTAAEQMARLETYHVFGRFVNDKAVELADRISALSPIDDPRIILGSGGGDGVDSALKLARRHWQLAGQPEKTWVLSRESGYHGLHGYGTAVAGIPFNREGYGSESLIPETARIDLHSVEKVEQTIQEIGPERIAAMIAEPIIGSGGVIPPVEGYLEGLQELARRYDILFIVDEVITGFGRTGEWFASHRWGLEPDMITFAKGVSSGYSPVGGVIVAPRVWDAFYKDADSPIYRHGITYSGHATSAALALTNLDILEREGLVSRAAELEKVLQRELTALEQHERVREIRSAGFLAGVALVDGVDGPALADRLIERGFTSRVLPGNTLQISPPFTTTDEEVRTLVAGIKDALDSSA